MTALASAIFSLLVDDGGVMGTPPSHICPLLSNISLHSQRFHWERALSSCWTHKRAWISAPCTPSAHKEHITEYVLPWCQCVAVQPHSLLKNNSHTDSNVTAITMLTRHVTSYSTANSERFVCRWFCVVHDPKNPLHSHNWLSFGKFQDTERFIIHCECHFSSRLPPSSGTWKYAKAPSTKKPWRDSLLIDMLLSAVSVLVVAQSSSEIPEGLMNNPVCKCNRSGGTGFWRLTSHSTLWRLPVSL